MNELLSTVIISIVTALGGAFAGWLFGRRKYNAEVSGANIQNFDAAIDAYQKLYEQREEIYKATIDDLNKRVDELTEENKELRRQITTISNFITAFALKGESKDSLDTKPLIDIALQSNKNNK